MKSRLFLALVGAIALMVWLYAGLRPELFSATFRDTLAFRWLPIGFAAVAFGTMFLPASWRLQMCLAFVALAGALYLAELYLIFGETHVSSTIHGLKLTGHFARAAGRPFDNRLGTQVIDDAEKAGHKIYWTISALDFIRNPHARTDDHGNWRPPVTIDNRDLLPLGTIPNVDNLYCNESGQWFIFHSDRYGFNNPDNVWDFDRNDIAVVGASNALGACLQPGESFIDLMRKVYPSTIALGSGGADPRVYLAMIVEYLTRVKPKLVYWLYYASPNRLLAERGNDWLDRYRRGEPALGIMEATPHFTPFLEKWHSEKRELYRKLEIEPRKEEFSLKNTFKLTHLRDRLGLNQCVDIDQQMDTYQDLLVVARKTVENWGGKLVVVEQAPYGGGCALFDFTRSSDNWLRQQFHKAAGDAGVEVLDAYPPFLRFADPERLYYYPGSHYSPEGAKLFADLLIAYAKQHLQ